MHHLAALSRLTRLTYSNNAHVPVDAVRAITQLTRLRSLWLMHPPTLSDVQLAQLSTLSRLTFLGVIGDSSAAIRIPHCSMRCMSFANLWRPYDAQAAAPPVCSHAQHGHHC